MRALLAGFVILLPVGCGESRSRDEVVAEIARLPRLYLTETSRVRVVAPGNRGFFTDPATREACWPALTCTHPECPLRHGAEPYLFIESDTVVADIVVGCPACAALRAQRAETDLDRQHFTRFVQPYELPDVRVQQERLEAEYRRIHDGEVARRR